MPGGSPSCQKTYNSLDKSKRNAKIDNPGWGKVFLNVSLMMNIFIKGTTIGGNKIFLEGKKLGSTDVKVAL